MENKTAYQEWEERCKKEIEILFSDFGEELQRNLVAQGYEEILFEKLMVLFGSGFTAIKIIKRLREEIEANFAKRYNLKEFDCEVEMEER